MKIPWLSILSLGLALPGGQTLDIQARAVSDILNSINQVQTRLTAVDNAILNFRATVTSALGFLSVYNALSNEIRSATNAVTSTGLLSSADSGSVVLALGNLTERVTRTQNNAIAKEPDVRAAGYAGTVCTVLGQLNTSTDAFFGAVSSNVDAAYVDQVLGFRATASGGFADSEEVWCT